VGCHLRLQRAQRSSDSVRHRRTNTAIVPSHARKALPGAVLSECTPVSSALETSGYDRSTAKATDALCGVSAVALAYVVGQRARRSDAVLKDDTAKRKEPQLALVMGGQAGPTDAGG